VAALGISLRLGVNPGEFIDLLLGLAGIDLFGDDIEVAIHPSTEQEQRATQP
jgi:hypothetical protein